MVLVFAHVYFNCSFFAFTITTKDTPFSQNVPKVKILGAVCTLAHHYTTDDRYEAILAAIGKTKAAKVLK